MEKKVTITDTDIRVYFDCDSWIVFHRFGKDRLYAGHVSSNAAVNQHVYIARQIALNCLK